MEEIFQITSQVKVEDQQNFYEIMKDLLKEKVSFKQLKTVSILVVKKV